MSFVVHTIHEFKGVRLSIKRKDFVLLGCGTYFIEDNTLQYSTVVILYDNTSHPLFTPDPCDYSSRGLPVLRREI